MLKYTGVSHGKPHMLQDYCVILYNFGWNYIMHMVCKCEVITGLPNLLHLVGDLKLPSLLAA